MTFRLWRCFSQTVQFDLHLVKVAVVNIDGATTGFAECKDGGVRHFLRISKQCFPPAATSIVGTCILMEFSASCANC